MFWWGIGIACIIYGILMCLSLLAISKKKVPKINMDNKYDNMIRTEWFKDHQATHTLFTDTTEQIIWRRPKSSNCYMNYLREGNYLHVTGDVGDAIYRTGFSTFKEWAQSDISYFAGKCIASENGRQYREWDPDHLKRSVEIALQENQRSWDDFYKLNGADHFAYEQEWYMWLNDHGADFFGYDRCYWPTDGKQIAVRCRGHLIGLKMAVEQLAEDL